MSIHKPICVGLVFIAGLLAAGAPAAAQPKPIVVVNPAELKAGLLYDAWVEFKDKGDLSARQKRRAWAELENDFDPRALARRKANRGGAGLFDDRDLPILDKYLQGLEKSGAKIQIRSRWLNGATVIADKGVIEKLQTLPYVKAVKDFHLRKPRAMIGDKPGPAPKPPAQKAAPGAAQAKPAAPPIPPTVYGVADAQTRVLNLAPLHEAGFTGKGVRIAVVDCGFQLSSEAFHSAEHPIRVSAQKDFVENDDDVRPRPGIDPGNYTHGTLVLGSIASYNPGVVVGSAYDADLILANAEDGDEEYYLEERWFVAALEWAEARGADIVTSSLVLYDGYTWAQTDGKTAIQTIGMNIAAENGVVCFAGAGNNGNDTDPAKGSMMPPGDSALTIAVGAVGADGKIARFSSDGPSADGRVKPEVLSMGTRVGTVSITDPKGYSFASGTSLATPVLAGAAACVLQAHPGWTLKEFRKALFESADYWRREGKTDPLFVHGYGVPDAFRAAGLLVSPGTAAALEKPISVAFEEKIAEFTWPIAEIDPALPVDWSDAGFLVLEMRTSSTQRFSLWIRTASGKRRIMFHPFGLNVWMRAAVPLQYFKGRDARGMDLASTNNRRTDTFYIGVWGPFGSLKNVQSIGVEMDYPIGKPRLEIRAVSLAAADPGSAFLEKTPVLDAFGQWAHADWPRKVHSREQLDRELAAEEKTLDAAAAELNFGKYGGDLSTQTKATGFFRVEMIDGRWWFVDPEGHLFLSTGSNGISGGRAGENADLSLRRMAAWGMNTIGNWSSLRPTEDKDRKAYATMFRTPRSEPYFLGMPDVHSEEFARAVEQSAEKMCAPLKDDPWLLGYFLGNEPPWPRRESELVDMFLNGPECATQKALRVYLADGDTPERRADFITGMFERYLAMMDAAIRRADPNHLNLGIRFGGMPEEKILKMGKAFDVFSLNVYEYEPTRQLKRIFDVTGKPVLIGEFHFGVPADGLGAGLVQTADQGERAKAYRYYMEQAAALPGFVGAHWFQWTDQPVLGRMDGENYNIGFVDVTNRAYPELVEAARATHKRLGAVHAGKAAPFGERPKASAHGTPASPWDR